MSLELEQVKESAKS